jgi:preprotein translocase subunit YajC
VPDATVSYRVMGTGARPSSLDKSSGTSPLDASSGASPLLLSAFQTVPPAPGRESGTEVPAKAPSGSDPGAGAGAPSGPLGGMGMMLIMVVPLLLLLLFTSRSQQKKQAAVIASLKKGDRVLLQSGLIGRFVEIKDRYAIIDLGSGVKVEVLRSSIAGQDTPEAAASVEKK